MPNGECTPPEAEEQKKGSNRLVFLREGLNVSSSPRSPALGPPPGAKSA